MKKFYFIILAFLMNTPVQVALATNYNADSWTDNNDKLGGAIWWVGQGAKVAGIIAIIFGAWQLGMSFSSDEPGNRNKALFFLACGLILFWTPDILTLLMRWNIIDPSAW